MHGVAVYVVRLQTIVSVLVRRPAFAYTRAFIVTASTGSSATYSKVGHGKRNRRRRRCHARVVDFAPATREIECNEGIGVAFDRKERHLIAPIPVETRIDRSVSS